MTNGVFDWSDKEAKTRFNTSRLIVIIGWMFLLIIGSMILAGNVYMAINGIPLNETLSNWGGIVLGFLFGSFPVMVREFITDKQEEKK